MTTIDDVIQLRTEGKSRLVPPPRYALLPIAGAVGGVVRWLMLHPHRPLLTAALLGALLAQGAVSLETWLRRVVAA